MPSDAEHPPAQDGELVPAVPEDDREAFEIAAARGSAALAAAIRRLLERDPVK